MSEPAASLFFTPLRELAARVRARKVSPVALAEEALTRLDSRRTDFHRRRPPGY